jgi:heme-degrading monooxygenase HmoA
MFARVTVLQGSHGQMEEGIELFKQEIIPAARDLAGFQGLLTLVDREGGRNLTITFWESKEAMRASEEAANRLRAHAVDELELSEQPGVSCYEVIHSEVPAIVAA